MSKKEKAKRYQPDYDWLWETIEAPAILRCTIEGSPEDLALLDRAIDALEQDDQGIRGWGGWALESYPPSNPRQRVVDLVSGGQDVAESLIDAAEELYSYLARPREMTVTWQQLPRDTPLPYRDRLTLEDN